MDRSEWLKVRLTPEELAKLKAHSKGKGWNLSQAVRDWIRRLKQEPKQS